MSTSVNAGSRLDRLPIGPFHRRIMFLIGIGMFFDGFDIYLAGTVLGVTLKSGFSTLPQNAMFLSATFVGMMLGSFATGFLGDLYGRRFTYQFNLLVFGLASLAAAFAPNMMILIACRFVMGVGLGAENVVGYATMTEFVPARSRGKWLGFTTVCVVTGLPISLLVASLVVPEFGWRAMFVLGGIGVLIVWYLRKSLPESPRWLEAVGRTEEAEALMQSIEPRGGPGPAAAGAISRTDRDGIRRAGDAVHRTFALAHDRRLGLPDHHQHAALWVRDLAAGVLHQAGAQHRDLVRIFAADGAGGAGRLGDRRADRGLLGPQADHHRRVADLGRARHRLSLDFGSGAAAGGRLRADRSDLRAGGAAVRNLYPGTVPDRSAAARIRHRQYAGPRRHHCHPVPGGDAVRGPRRRRSDVADDRTIGGADHHGLGARHRTAASQPGRAQGRGHRAGVA